MSSDVATYDPNVQPIINLTPSAINHIKKEINKHQALGLRLGVKKAGCSGLKYLVDYVYEIDKTDRVITVENELNVFINPQNLFALTGLTLDYVKEGLNGKLKFINPNEKSSCGCGESFTTKD